MKNSRILRFINLMEILNFHCRFILSSAFPNEVFYVVHDFHTQLQYTINERSVIAHL